jgi:hypothetical protein
VCLQWCKQQAKLKKSDAHHTGKPPKGSLQHHTREKVSKEGEVQGEKESIWCIRIGRQGNCMVMAVAVQVRTSIRKTVRWRGGCLDLEDPEERRDGDQGACSPHHS